MLHNMFTHNLPFLIDIFVSFYVLIFFLLTIDFILRKEARNLELALGQTYRNNDSVLPNVSYRRERFVKIKVR